MLHSDDDDRVDSGPVGPAFRLVEANDVFVERPVPQDRAGGGAPERAGPSRPLAGGSWYRRAGAVPAIQSGRTDLTREGELVGTSAIGGVEVDAELRAVGICCTARLSDFGPGDLVVVQVEVALY